jgi:hypothetical protein
MERKLNRFGPNIAKLRQKRNWTHENWQSNFNSLVAISPVKFSPILKSNAVVVTDVQIAFSRGFVTDSSRSCAK